MKNFVQPGDTLTLVAPYTVASGAGAKVGALFGVAKSAVTSGASGEFQTEGVFTLAKHDSQAWVQGARIYWDDTNKWCSNVATDGMFIGNATSAVASTAGLVTGNVKLQGSPELAQGKQAAVTALTISVGTPATTLVDVTATPTQATVNSNFASVGTQLNAIITALQAAGILT